MSTRRDDPLVIGTRCTADGCEWGPVATEDPDAWDVIERARLEHERDTGHLTTVETARRERALANGVGSEAATGGLTDALGLTVEWTCPDCGRTATADELDGGSRCPDCEGWLREVAP